MSTTKKSHKFLVFLIIILIINAIITPFTYKVVKNIMLSNGTITEVSAPETINFDCDNDNQKFINLLFYQDMKISREANLNYNEFDVYFCGNGLIDEIANGIDKAIKENENFNNRNEYLTYLTKANKNAEFTNLSGTFLGQIAMLKGFSIGKIEKTINNKLVIIGFINENIDEENFDTVYDLYMKNEVESYFNK